MNNSVVQLPCNIIYSVLRQLGVIRAKKSSNEGRYWLNSDVHRSNEAKPIDLGPKPTPRYPIGPYFPRSVTPDSDFRPSCQRYPCEVNAFFDCLKSTYFSVFVSKIKVRSNFRLRLFSVSKFRVFPRDSAGQITHTAKLVRSVHNTVRSHPLS